MDLMFPGVVIAAALVVALNALRLVRWYSHAKSHFQRWAVLPEIPDEQLPKVAVLFSLRGADPSLSVFLESLLNQDYPHYSVRIAVDTPEDPSWEYLRAFESHPRWSLVEVELLNRENPRASFKNLGIIQLEQKLPADVEFLLILDSDAHIESDAIRRMIVPLVASGEDVSTGVRWFQSNAPGLGTTMRYLWNVESALYLIARKYPWGGACAIRRRFFVDSNVAETWGRALSDDVCLGSLLQQTGGKLTCAPLVRCSEEHIGLANFIRFGKRQMWMAYLYDIHRIPAYINVVLMALSVAILIRTAIYSIIIAQPWWCAGALVTLLAYGFVMQSLERRLDRLFQPESPPLPLSRKLQFALLQGFEQGLQGWWFLSAPFVEKLQWRGVTYEIRGPFDLDVTEIQPMTTNRNAPTESVV